MDPAEPPVPTPFVLVTVQRSGSTYLGTVLSRVPGVFCADELFIASEGGLKPGFFYGHWRERVAADPGAILPPRRREMVESFLDAVWAAQPELAAQGFDIKYNQLAEERDLLPALRRRKVRVLHLLRGNVLKTHVSTELNDRQEELGRRSHGTERVPAVAIDLDPGRLAEALAERVRVIERHREELRTGLETMEVVYEDCVAGRDSEYGINARVLGWLCAFLGVPAPPTAPRTDLVKTNPSDLRRSIANFDAVRQALAGTVWEHLLYEGAPELWNPGGLEIPGYLSPGPLLERLALRAELHAASCLLAAQGPAQAAAALADLPGRMPGQPWVHLALALAQERAGAPRLALEQYERALALAPGMAEALLGRARVLGALR